MRRTMRLPAGLVAIALLAAACSGGGGSTSAGSSGGVKNGGTLRIGTASGIDSLNPFVAQQQDAYSTFEYIYPFLVQYNTNDLQFTGDFATSWNESADGLTWTFHTHPNAKWSDGQPLTANDAAWTLNTILKFSNGPTGNSAGMLAHVKSVTAPDANTLVITYQKPVANVLSNLQQVAILPEHVWQQYATGKGTGLRTYNNQPTPGHPVVSGGPFVLVSYTPKQIALFQRNPNFYGRKPHIDGFGLQYFANDDAMITALKSHQIDAVETVPVTSVATLKAAGLHVYVGPGLEFHDFIINANPKKTTHRELLNPLVREAFEYAINRQQIVKTAWLGYAQPGASIVPPGTGAWSDPSVTPLPFDIQKANQLLDQAGYKRGPNGIRIADGHPMSYQVIFPNDEAGAGDRAFQIIQAGFQQIGVQLQQRPMDDTAAFNAISAPNSTYQTFDLAMWDWVPLEDPDFILSVLTCSQYGNWSDSGYCNPAYDKLYQEQGVAVNPKARQQLVYQMQQMIYNARPYIVLNYQDVIDAWWNNWTGFVESNQNFFNPLSKQSLTEVHQT